jgi:hypothetical protein
MHSDAYPEIGRRIKLTQQSRLNEQTPRLQRYFASMNEI